MSTERKGPVSVDMRAMRGLGTPRRGGCVTFLFFGLAAGALCIGSGLGLSSMELSSAERVCASVPIGMPRADVEARLASELDARLNGSGGPAGGPIAYVELGERGELVSWSCQVSLDAMGNTTGSRFHSWVVPDFHGGWDEPITAILEGILPG